MDEQRYKQLTLKEFDVAANRFDDNTPSVYNMCRKDYPDILEELEKEPFEFLLDAGCGTGAVISLLNKKYPNKHYTGIDLSTKMIEVANNRNIKNAKFVNGDCEALPFEKETFDVIICSMSFHHYPNPDKFFKNCYKVLKKDGRLIIRDMTSYKIPLWFVNHIEIPLMNFLAHKGDVHTYSKAEIQKLCDMSGLKLERFEQRKGFRLHAVCRKYVNDR